MRMKIFKDLPEKSTILLDKKKIQYYIKKSKRAKHLLLHIDYNGTVEVVVPLRRIITLKQIEKFLMEKKRWILRNLKKTEEIARKANKRRNFLLFLGREVPIEIIESKRKRAIALASAGKLIVKVPVGKNELAKKAIQQFYKKQAKRIIAQLAEKNARKMNVSFSRISIRSQKTLWGSCSPRKVLSFNWRLIAAPQEIIKYIIVHELAHLLHRNHSKVFWKTVQKYCPDYKKHEKWLRKNSDFIKARTNL